MSRALELGVNQNLHRKALVSSTGEKGAAREREWLEITTTQGNQRRGLGRTGGGKKRGHCRAGRRPLCTRGQSDPRHTVPLLHTRAHSDTHAHTLLHTWIWLPHAGKRDRRGGARCGKGAWGLRGARAASPPPSARARARSSTHAAPLDSCSCASPPNPHRPRVPGWDAVLAGTPAGLRRVGGRSSVLPCPSESCLCQG